MAPLGCQEPGRPFASRLQVPTHTMPAGAPVPSKIKKTSRLCREVFVYCSVFVITEFFCCLCFDEGFVAALQDFAALGFVHRGFGFDSCSDFAAVVA